MKLTVGRGNKAVTVVSEFEMAIATGYRFCLDNSVGYTEGNSSYWTSGVKEDYFWEQDKLTKVTEFVTSTNTLNSESEVLTHDFKKAVEILKKIGFEEAFNGSSWTTIDLSDWDHSWDDKYNEYCDVADEANRFTETKARFAINTLHKDIVFGKFNYVRESFGEISIETYDWIFFLGEDGMIKEIKEYENEKRFNELKKQIDSTIPNTYIL
jgi:hypothetical protein